LISRRARPRSRPVLPDDTLSSTSRRNRESSSGKHLYMYIVVPSQRNGSANSQPRPGLATHDRTRITTGSARDFNPFEHQRGSVNMQTQQPAAFTATPILTLKDLDSKEPWDSTRPARVGRAFRGTDRPLVQFSGGRTVLRIGSGTRSPERSMCSTEGTECSTPWTSTTRTGAATVCRVRGAGTNTRISRFASVLATQSEAGNQRELTDRQPGPVSFARILNPGYQKGRKKAGNQHGEAHGATSTMWRTTGSCLSTGAPTSSRLCGRIRRAAAITTSDPKPAEWRGT